MCEGFFGTSRPESAGENRTGGLLRWPLLVAPSLALLLVVGGALPAAAQDWGNPYGEWRYWGADLSSTRYSPLDQINADNFGDLEVAWVWRGDNYGPSPDFTQRNTPIYADGLVYTLAGSRRTLVAVDPATGETLWTFREPYTDRWQASPRKNYGRGVAYGEVDGRGVIYMVTPAFFLHALDAHLRGWVGIHGRRAEAHVGGARPCHR